MAVVDGCSCGVAAVLGVGKGLDRGVSHLRARSGNVTPAD